MAKSETSEQQSYFYVVWPEERSPSAAATAPASTNLNLVAMNAAGPSIGAAAGSLTPIDTLLQQSSNTSPPVCTGLATHSAGVVPGASSLPLAGATQVHSPTTAATSSRTVAASTSGTEDSDSSDAGSPALTTTTNQSTTAAVIEAQTVTITDSGEFSGSLTPITSATTPHNVLISPKSHAFGLGANGTGNLATVYNPIVSSPGLIYVSDASPMLPRSHPPGPASAVYRGNGSSMPGGSGTAALLHPVQELNQRKHKYPQPSVEPPPLRSIGRPVVEKKRKGSSCIFPMFIGGM